MCTHSNGESPNCKRYWEYKNNELTSKEYWEYKNNQLNGKNDQRTQIINIFNTYSTWIILAILLIISLVLSLVFDLSIIKTSSASRILRALSWVSNLLSIFLALLSIYWTFQSGKSTEDKVEKISDVYADFKSSKDELITTCRQISPEVTKLQKAINDFSKYQDEVINILNDMQTKLDGFGYQFENSQNNNNNNTPSNNNYKST